MGPGYDKEISVRKGLLVLVSILLAVGLTAGDYKLLESRVGFTYTSDTTGPALTIRVDTIQIGTCSGFNAIRGRVWINGPLEGTTGMGLDDSGIIKVVTKDLGTPKGSPLFAGSLRVLAADTVGQLPCSVTVNVTRATNDTTNTLGDEIWVIYEIIDTLTDTLRTGTYRIDPYLSLR